jgi:hypothetical protein
LATVAFARTGGGNHLKNARIIYNRKRRRSRSEFDVRRAMRTLFAGCVSFLHFGHGKVARASHGGNPIVRPYTRR